MAQNSLIVLLSQLHPLCVHISVQPSEAPKELVIPLIQNGHLRQPPTQAPGPSTHTEVLVDGMLSQAVKELIEGE